MHLTYLPLPTFKDSVRSLKTSDLRDSIRSVLYVLDFNREFLKQSYLPSSFFSEENPRLQDEPLCKMWRGYEGCLKLYGWTGISELHHRGEEHGVLHSALEKWGHPDLNKLPPWFFDLSCEGEKKDLMSSHRNYLASKDTSYVLTYYDVGVLMGREAREGYKIFYPTSTNHVVDPIFLEKV